MHYVYILKSQKDNSLYIGSTENVKNRLKEHNRGESTYSKTKKPFSLVWFCIFPNKQKALAFEKYLKHGSGHAFTKKHLI
jgi:putative endonuclease